MESLVLWSVSADTESGDLWLIDDFHKEGIWKPTTVVMFNQNQTFNIRFSCLSHNNA